MAVDSFAENERAVDERHGDSGSGAGRQIDRQRQVNRRSMLASALATGVAASSVMAGPARAQRSVPIIAASAGRWNSDAAPGGRAVIVLDSPAGFRNAPRDQGRQYLVVSRTEGWAGRSRPIGGGLFYWDAISEVPEDGGMVFAVPGVPVGRFLRVARGGREVSATWWGAQCDGITDDSLFLQSALNYLESIGGGVLAIEGVVLCGNLTVNFRNLTVQGKSRSDTLLVKSGTIGVRVQESWVNFRHLSIVSQGSKDDGLQTRGVLYSAGSKRSVGHVYSYDIDIKGFSGIGVELRNVLDFNMVSCFFRDCAVGLKICPNGSANNDFSTTVSLESVYAISCDIGVYAERLYRSVFNIIGEYNRIAIKVKFGQITLNGCYFESNIVSGVEAVDAGVYEIDTYSNNPITDRVSRSWNSGVVAAQDRGYRKESKFDNIAKRFGVLGGDGVDVEYLSAHDSSNNSGLRYGHATVALSRGANLAVPEAWTSEAEDEFCGWDYDRDGYKILARASRERCGMRQNVSLTKGKSYIIDFKGTNIRGNISSILVDGINITPGVPFISIRDGDSLIQCFGVSSGAFEVYINVFSLTELVTDVGLIADTQDRLSRRRDGRGLVLSAGPPSGAFGVGEWVREKYPSEGGCAAYVRTKRENGTKGEVWAGIPLGMRRSEAHMDSQADSVASLRADFNALLKKLRDAGIVASDSYDQ